MKSNTDCVDLLCKMWSRMDTQDWDGVAATLHPEFRAEYVHTGERFDADTFVRLNRDYPGSWRTTVDEVVGEGSRAVTRTRVHDEEQTFFVASFGETRDDKLIRLVEVWADSNENPPPGTRP